MHIDSDTLLHRIRARVSRVSAELAVRRARLWQQLYGARYRYLIWQTRYGRIAAVFLALMLMAASAYWSSSLQRLIEPYFSTEANLALLRSLFLTLGGALIGAAAIVSSLVLFAMQVNIERMPHGLFRRLSNDWRLLSAFAGTFILAIAIASLSLIPATRWVGLAVFAAAWSTVLVLVLFLYGYQRALLLVNPVQQLALMVRLTRRELRIWVRRAERAAPLIAGNPTDNPQHDDPQTPQHDLDRLIYFQANPGWTEGALRGIRYAITFVRRFAEQGDHEVSEVALSAIIAINSAYVEAKGRTFFHYQLMLDNPYVSDGFINDALEHLRQTTRIGVARGDETQIEQTLRAMAALAYVYLSIDYSTAHASKTHAHLAIQYLIGEVERILPRNMPDVLMEGMQLMGQCADRMLAVEGPGGIATLVQKIGIISCAGVTNNEYRAVTSTGVEQLARLTFNLLRSNSGEIMLATEGLRNSVIMVAKLFMTIPDTPLDNIHSTYLASYYSATSAEGLAQRMRALVNSVAEAQADDQNARQVIQNFADWADGMYRAEKDLLLRAIEKRSHFTFDMIHWITSVTTMLIAMSNTPACDQDVGDELRKHARWLIAVLSWIPDDKETVTFVETFGISETLFESAIDARNRGLPELADEIGEMLLEWAFKAGQYRTGWAILPRSIFGLATLALLSKDTSAAARLKAEIASRLANKLPDEEIRRDAGRQIRERARSGFHRGRSFSAIDQSMAQVDQAKMQLLLNEIADLISTKIAS